MLDTLRNLLRAPLGRPRPAPPAGRRPAVPPHARVYAVGDVHGRVDLFDALAETIERDDAARGPADTTIVLLGDLVDRGPDSAAVVARARAWQQRRKVRCIGGNHEEMFLAALESVDACRAFLRFGGDRTVESYAGVPCPDDVEAAQALLRASVPEADITFLHALENQVAIGDYLFVHAGIRPGTPIISQRGRDMRWIREPFLGSDDDHGRMVVHGHTIAEDAVFRSNRIGIDTGAFASGRLTALGLEGTRQWLIETTTDYDNETGDTITVSSRPVH